MKIDPGWFAGRLRELRTAAGLSQQALADAIGYRVMAVSRWETGDREPTWGSVCAICDALGVGPEQFAKRPAQITS